MQKTSTKPQKSVHMILVVLLCGFFLTDSMLMFFIEPSLMYLIMAMAVLFLAGLVLLKVKKELMLKEISRLRAFLLVFGAILINSVAEVVRMICF
ncbi:hypothetical protein CON36_34745 [Bacillus cereus]|uniref:Uncharacterized protein n=2 Tax=Bacillus cereus group TaxID=86661 RepID=A0A9X6SSC5_BACCE|nr:MULTISPECIES: hypothetical protein [Bacillus cereus group]PDZ94259.1 hypothetical protein CON36_34745 [Bacillus cereus]PFJ24797.1 hypothetical protein COJ15_36110 [Bacillus thuringiensis]PGP11575.1 hypothetical protein COA01_35550 [Bacillus cereus]